MLYNDLYEDDASASPITSAGRVRTAPAAPREGTMNTTTTARIVRQTAEDHQRRAAQAEREGVRILVDHRTGQHVATSASDASRCYHVTLAGCTCRGFTFWGRCKHHSLLLAELGRIPDDVSLIAGLSDAEVIAIKADAMRRHAFHGEPLIDVHTGAIIAA